MRIAMGGYEHETNTFSTIYVTEEMIRQEVMTGQDLIARCRGVHCMNGGTIDACRDLGIELVPVSRAAVTPCNITRKEAFEAFRDHMTEEIWRAHCEKPLDAIALNIHGAAIAEGYPDVEAELLRALRDRFGPDIPIGITLDLHGNITPEMIRLCNITVGFKTYPHVDNYESAYQVIGLLHEQLTSGRPLHQALVRLPLHMAPAAGVTLSGAARDIMLYNEDLVKKNPECRDVTFFQGFPYADVPFSGASVTAVAETPEAALRFAQQAAEYAWSRRHGLNAPIHSASEAMDLAEKEKGIVVINEDSDNPGGGAPGDGTHLLREMVKRDLPGSVYGFIHDPETAEMALAAGPGGRIDCLVGGKTDSLHGEPLKLKGALVKTLSEGTYISKNPMGAGSTVHLGLTALLQTGNVGIIVSKARRQVLDDGPFRVVGIDWRDMRIIALKSAQHFKAWWAGKADAIIPCDSPGIQSADLNSFDFKYLDKNFYPFKDAGGFIPVAEAVH